MGVAGNTYRRTENYKFKKKCQSPNFWNISMHFVGQNLDGNEGFKSKASRCVAATEILRRDPARSGEIAAGQCRGRGSLFATL